MSPCRDADHYGANARSKLRSDWLSASLGISLTYVLRSLRARQASEIESSAPLCAARKLAIATGLGGGAHPPLERLYTPGYQMVQCMIKSGGLIKGRSPVHINAFSAIIIRSCQIAVTKFLFNMPISIKSSAPSGKRPDGIILIGKDSRSSELQ